MCVFAWSFSAAGRLFRSVEGLECFAGGVVVGVGAKGCADAVAVELLPHRPEDAADGEADAPSVEVLNDPGEDRGCGVVDVSDGRAVQNYPAQRATVAGYGRDFGEELGSVGVVEVGPESVDNQPLLGPGARHDRGGQPVPGR